MMVLWEKKFINVKKLGKYLYLDSGTLTPVLKKLEQKGYIKRDKSQKDERNLVVSISSQGELLKNKIKDIPQEMGKCLNLDEEETVILYKVLYKIIKNIDEIGE
jgi:DNA-binding MarR family transcriptional regulator